MYTFSIYIVVGRTHSITHTQQQMYALSANPAYNIVPEHSQQPLQQDDRTYSNIDISQQEAVVLSGSPKHGAALKAAASAE